MVDQMRKAERGETEAGGEEMSKAFDDLRRTLDALGLVITLKEPTDAMLKSGWHCIDFDRQGYREGQTTWDRPPPHQTSMKQDVRDAFVTMNEAAQAEINKRLAISPRRHIRHAPRRPQP